MLCNSAFVLDYSDSNAALVEKGHDECEQTTLKNGLYSPTYVLILSTFHHDLCSLH